MRTSTSRLRQTSSLIAGVLIGLAIVGMVFATTAVEAASDLPILLALGSLMVFVVGLALQIVITITPMQRPRKGATDMRTANASGPKASESVAM